MELLDKKGLTTVWAAIKNTFTSKSDADGKYAKKADLADYAKKNKLADELSITPHESQANFTLLDIDGIEICDSVLQRATSTQAGVMTSADKNKLDGIDSGANNYKLPVASSSTLGGIKVSENADGTNWPICVDSNGLAWAKILGLAQARGELFGITLKGGNIETNICPTQISTKLNDEEPKVISIPLKSGTFAITSDCGLLVMNGGIVNNNIGFNGYKQNVLISVSGNYNISNWYNSSPVGSVMDIYPYADINGTITADNKYIFQTMGTSSSGLPIIVTKKSINLSNSHYIRLIHISGGVYVCVSVLGY